MGIRVTLFVRRITRRVALVSLRGKTAMPLQGDVGRAQSGRLVNIENSWSSPEHGHVAIFATLDLATAPCLASPFDGPSLGRASPTHGLLVAAGTGPSQQRSATPESARPSEVASRPHPSWPGACDVQRASDLFHDGSEVFLCCDWL
jgi:hypothetical protein